MSNNTEPVIADNTKLIVTYDAETTLPDDIEPTITNDTKSIVEDITDYAIPDTIEPEITPPIVFITSEDNDTTQEIFEDLKVQPAEETQPSKVAEPIKEAQPMKEIQPSEEEARQKDTKAKQKEGPLPEENTKHIPELSGPVLDFYKHKNILMTGATGFIGKSILWKLIHSLGHNIGRVYILIRSGSNKRSKIGRPAERLKNEIFNNKVSCLFFFKKK